MTDTSNSRYGSPYTIKSVDDAIDKLVEELKAEYPTSEESPFQQGYKFCITAALKGLGLEGDALEHTVSTICQSVTVTFTPSTGALVYSETDVAEEGTVVKVLTHRVAVDFGSGDPEWYPRGAFVQRDKPYVDTTQRLKH